jgi:hypothetical protein
MDVQFGFRQNKTTEVGVMAGKPSKWSSQVELNSQELDDEWNAMSFDRAETRRHFLHNEVQSPEDKEYEAIKSNESRLRDFHERGNERGKTFRKVRGD